MIASIYNSWELLAQVLNRILSGLPETENKNITTTCFDAIKAPKISIYDYLARIRKYADCSDACYIVAFIYLDRALQSTNFLRLSHLNIHRLILISVVLAIKYLDDSYASNLVYSRIGGISLAEFNLLEREMIQIMDFDFYVDSELFFNYANELYIQSAKINEELMEAEEKMADCDYEILKPLRPIMSTASMETEFHNNGD